MTRPGRGLIRLSQPILWLSLAQLAHAEPLSRAALDAIWQRYMLEGTAATVTVHDSDIAAAQRPPLPDEAVQSRAFEIGITPEHAALAGHGITVTRLGEGFWGNGGWILKGGLLGRADHGASVIELYGKAVVRQHAHLPLPLHRPVPHDSGYEFFLLLRRIDPRSVTIVRRWVFDPQEVAVQHLSDGGTMERVEATLRYAATTRTATVTITGLARPFEVQVDLEPALGPASR